MTNKVNSQEVAEWIEQYPQVFEKIVKPRAQLILLQRYCLPERITQKTIAEQLGLSKARVAQIEQKALTRFTSAVQKQKDQDYLNLFLIVDDLIKSF